jgi:hypothetical protein
MDTEKLGIRLADLIDDTLDESTEDISNTLDKSPAEILFESIALLLWIAAKEASMALPTNSYQRTIDYMYSAVYLRLSENAEFSRLCNKSKWEDFIHNRFSLYYRAWDAHRSERGIVLEDEEANQELSIVTVAHNFVLSCLSDTDEDIRKTEAEFRKIPNYRNQYRANMECVLRYYRRFSERVKSVLSCS